MRLTKYKEITEGVFVRKVNWLEKNFLGRNSKYKLKLRQLIKNL